VDRLNDEFKQPLVELLLSIADDKFILGHRNADWTGLAPILEEDIAFSSLSQDELAHATALYQMAAGFLETTADKLAFARKPAEFRCAQIVELSDGFNWATALCRNFFCDHFDFLRLTRLANSSYTPLAQLSGRLAAEEKIHVEHVDSWMKRLGRSGDPARSRMQESLNDMAIYAPMLMEAPEGMEILEMEGIYPKTEPGLFDRWKRVLGDVARDAGLILQIQAPAGGTIGGRRGKHSAGFPALVDELTEIFRLEPEAAW
jgi:ring-1,2-phenylacetyl-CoA epoxidase subunit PaaC